jgi:bifunctional non-homologous end joining protein LigD
MPYSPRARAVPGIATPLSWEELPNLSAADLYTIDNIGNRMAHLRGDPWAAMPKIAQTLPKAAPSLAPKRAGPRA